MQFHVASPLPELSPSDGSGQTRRFRYDSCRRERPPRAYRRGVWGDQALCLDRATEGQRPALGGCKAPSRGEGRARPVRGARAGVDPTPPPRQRSARGICRGGWGCSDCLDRERGRSKRRRRQIGYVRQGKGPCTLTGSVWPVGASSPKMCRKVGRLPAGNRD